jgi:hypothetical protein
MGKHGHVPAALKGAEGPEGDLVVEEYGVMGMSAENYRACAQAFRQLSCAG